MVFKLSDLGSLPKVFIALFDYTPPNGQGKDELAFLKGDEFVLKSDNEQRWLFVKHVRSGKTGMVPSNFVAAVSEMENLKWCHLGSTREDATKELTKEFYDLGSFIIRSASGKAYSEALVLTVKSKAKILHFAILRDGGLFHLHRENAAELSTRFSSLTKLVKHHSRFKDGMTQLLVYSVKKNIQIDPWNFEPDEVQMTDSQLGEGQFGEVVKGLLNGKFVAVKTLIAGKGMTEEQFLKEADMARDFRHENIVRTLGVCSVGPFIVVEFMSGGSLKKYIENTEKPLSPEANLTIARKIACAMTYLEESRIVHRDLAARNILVGESHDVIKLADFGLARCLEDKVYYQNNMHSFPHKWSAPEAFVIVNSEGELKQAGKSTSASDVWSFAVVLWELYTRMEDPYDGLSGLEIFYQLTRKKLRLHKPQDCPEEIYAKMLACWSLEPADRPTFANLVTFLATSPV